MLRYNLEAEGFAVAHAATGEAAEMLIAEEVPDLVILDWMLPQVSGIELCRRLQCAETRAVPIIMLTARGEENDRIRGLSIGADDYVVKPFSLPELMARICACLRRSAPERISDVLVYDDIELDRSAHRVAPLVRCAWGRRSSGCWSIFGEQGASPIAGPVARWSMGSRQFRR